MRRVHVLRSAGARRVRDVLQPARRRRHVRRGRAARPRRAAARLHSRPRARAHRYARPPTPQHAFQTITTHIETVIL